MKTPPPPRRGKGRPRLADHLCSPDVLRARAFRERMKREGYKTKAPTVAKIRRGYLVFGELKRKLGVFAEERGSCRHNGKLSYGFTL